MFSHSFIYSKYVSALIVTALVLLVFPPSFLMLAQAEETESPVVTEVIETPVEETPLVAEEMEPVEATEQTEITDGDGAEGGEALIETGDAVAETELQNGVNINDTDLNTTTTPFASTTESLTDEELDNNQASSTPTNLEVEVNATNTGAVLNTATTTAETGANEIASSSQATIITGNGFAAANVLNVVNLNVFNSSGLMLLLNNFFGLIGNLDLRQSDFGEETINNCGGGCQGSASSLETTVTNDNTATITNNLVVRSGTGGNTINGAYAGLINTGDAYAAANVINVANTNITNSNYLLMVFNNFGAWGGDLIFPSQAVFDELGATGGSGGEGGTGSNSVAVTNDNEATINNNITTEADTGSNSAEGSELALIQTGNATAGTNLVNQVNQNAYGGTSVMLLIRVYGNWSGSVFNAPANISWQETPFGIQLFNTDGEMVNEAADLANGTGANTTTVANKNVAGINNNVAVYALTGENKIENSDEARISTGDAYAGSNIVNIANTNIYGRNWVLAIINIFGDWAGNISFGQPDLWVGGAAQVSGQVTPNSTIDYTFTVANRGDADAHNVRLSSQFKQPFAKFKSAGDGWLVGDIPAGESVEVTYQAQIETDTQLPPGESAIEQEIKVTADETDANRDDNTDLITVMAYNKRGVIDASMVASQAPVMELKKTASTNEVTASSSVDYAIVINNYGNKAYKAVLVDQLENEAGKIIAEQSWPLETIEPNEEINVTYTTNFSASTTPGKYTNYARVFAENGKSTIASSTITVVGPIMTVETENPEPTVAGAMIERHSPAKEITKRIQPLYKPLDPINYTREPSNFFTRILMAATMLPQNPLARLVGLALIAGGLSILVHRRRLEWRWGFRFTIF